MEMIDIVNDNDEVIGQTTRQKLYQQLHQHRIVHILIFNGKGEMALQLRTKDRSYCPHHWSTAVGGHVQSGENYKEAALREFIEELGQNTDITFLGKDRYITLDKKVKKFLTTFKTTFSGPFEINPEEVERVEFFSLKEIQKMVDSGEKFHPELLFLLNKYFNIKIY